MGDTIMAIIMAIHGAAILFVLYHAFRR